MRSTLLALLASVAIVSATGCVQNNIDDLAARTTCGHSKTISKCLHKAADLAQLEEIERCFISGGCDVADATAEAVWFAHDCRAFEVQEAENELKRRASADSTTAASTTHSSTTTAKTTSTAKSTTAKSSTATVASTSATTTSDSTTTTDSTTSSASTASSTTSQSTSSSTTTGTAASVTTTGTLACSVTSTVSTSACSISGGKTISCYSTTTAIASCAPGLICFTATAGADVCMKRDDSLTTSGLVVTIAFAIGIVAAIIAFVVVGLRARSKAKNEQQQRLLQEASSGRGNDIEAANAFSGTRGGGPAVSDSNLPLITAGAQRSEDYNGGQHDNFSQGQAPAPRINPGLGALGQEARY